MSKRSILAIVFCFISSLGAILFLFAMSGIMKDKRSSFLRQFPPHPVLEGEALDIKFNSFYIAGGTNHHFYLANSSAPLQMLVVNSTLTDTQHVTLRIKGIEQEKFRAIKVKVDSPDFYFADGTVPAIYHGNVYMWKARRYMYDSVYFLDFVPLGGGSVWIKSLGAPVKENVLGKISAKAPFVLIKRDILQKQIDGLFCTEGMMHYSRELARLVYVYHYRNEFIVMDTSMNVTYRGHTIDTTTHARIKVATVASDGTHTMAAPPFTVNKRSSVSGHWLFVNSGLLARNEHPDALNQAAVVDVYDLRDGKYAFSFYIYDFQGHRLTSFQVYGQHLIGIFGRNIQVYHLREAFFPKNVSDRAIKK